MRYLISITIALLLNVGSLFTSDVYDYNYTIGIGLKNFKLMGDNINTQTIAPRPPTNRVDLGANFGSVMPGIEVLINYQLDNDGDFRMPIRLGYTFMSTREKLPVTPFVTARFLNDAQIFNSSLGLNYTLYRMPLAKALIYLGAELSLLHIHNTVFTRKVEYDNIPSQNTTTKYPKDDALRIGSGLRLGIEGEVVENYMVNVSWGLESPNLFLRDNARGQLFTPNIRISEEKEDMLINFVFSLVVSYRF